MISDEVSTETAGHHPCCVVSIELVMYAPEVVPDATEQAKEEPR